MHWHHSPPWMSSWCKVRWPVGLGNGCFGAPHGPPFPNKFGARRLQPPSLRKRVIFPAHFRIGLDHVMT
jgi:hypothetical protein